MLKALALLLAFAASAFAQENDTAYRAMRTVGNTLGRGALNRIVEVSGVKGRPQPEQWRVSLADRNFASGLREVIVANGQIVSDRASEAAAASTTPISTAKLNLDSSGAYAVAAHTADTSHVVFDHANYTLSNDKRGNPTWIIALEGRGREVLGTIHVGANRGNITRVEGMYRGRNVEERGDQITRNEGAPPPLDQDDADENIIKRKVKQAFRNASRDAADMFHRWRRSFADFIDPERHER